MPTIFSATYTDFDGEKSTMKVLGPDLTAANLVDLSADWADLLDATEDLTLGVRASSKISMQSAESAVLPTTPNASRENKWLVIYTDIQTELALDVPNPGYGKRFNIEIPTANRSLLTGQSDILHPRGNPSEAADDWISAFESLARSPYGGAVQVIQIRAVGRNI